MSRYTQQHAQQPADQPLLGSLSLACGAGLAILVVMDRTGGLPFDLPRFWYVNRWLWAPLSIGFFVVGAALLKTRPSPGTDWRPSRPGRRFEALVLYTRKECHLCDQAKDVLLKYASYLPPIHEVEIDEEPELAEKFGRCVPVVEIDGKFRFRGRIDEILLRRLIEATRPGREL